MKQFVGYLIKKAMKKGKVAPTIKSVKPTKDIKGSVKRVYRDETSKRIDAVAKTKAKMESGRKMMREAQKEQKRLVDTGRAFQFKHSKGIHSIRPGENPKKQYKGLIKEDKPQKKFKTGKELAREKKMGGGMMGRRFGYKKGSGKKFPDLTGDGKVTFADILKGRGVINGKKKGKA
jgi:hypothetical protein